MAFKSLEIISFEKKQVLLNFCLFFFFVYLLPDFVNERSRNTLSLFGEAVIELNFEGQSMALRLRRRFLAKLN